MKVSGIYKIESISHPERIYVGSAMSIEMRWKDHRNKLNRGSHENSKLQNHYNKYGKEDLIYTILALCGVEELTPINGVIWLEQLFMDSYKAWFNIARIAGSSKGVKHSAEVCKRQSERLKGVNTWSKGRTLTPDHIAKVSKSLMGNQHAKGFKHSEETKLKESIFQRSRTKFKRGWHFKMPEGFGRKQAELMMGNKYGVGKGEKHKISILQYDLSMNFIKEWPSATDASKQLGISISIISSCLREVTKKPTKFIWKYKNI